MSSPTQRTLAHLRKAGATCQVVERWCQHSRRRIDLFGVIDIVAIGAAGGIHGIQACAGASHANRKAKILAEPRAKLWVKSGGLLWLTSWTKKGAAGKRKLWAVRDELITLDMFPDTFLESPEFKK